MLRRSKSDSPPLARYAYLMPRSSPLLRSSASKPSSRSASRGSDLALVEAFLCSGMVDGVTQSMARRLIDRFGPKAVEAIESSDPDAKILLGDKFDRACDDLISKERHRENLMWLASLGAGAGIAKAALTWMRNEAVEKPEALLARWKKDPYALCEISGIGFASADQFARNSGIGADSPQRIEAAGHEAIKKACDDAGGGAYPNEVVKTCQRLLASNNALSFSECSRLAPEAAQKAIDSGKAKMAKDEQGRPMYFSAELYEAEEYCAQKFLLLADQPHHHTRDIEAELAAEQEKHGLTLNPMQEEAVRTIFKGRVSIICGKPGAGKTTLLRIAAPLLSAGGRKVLYAAPTGKAAKRMSQSLGRPAQTIHRLLGMGPRDSAVEGSKGGLMADVIVIDEASMIDALMMRKLLSAMGPKTSLLLLGDPDQLPSVGAGKILYDLISSQALPTCMLTKPMRQAAGSNINTVARAISEGSVPDLSDKTLDCLFLPEADGSRIASRIHRMLTVNASKHDALKDAQVLTASKKGSGGADALNPMLQALLNPPSIEKPELGGKLYEDSPQRLFRLGDKVMQLSNDYERQLVLAAAAGPNPADPGEEGKETKGVFNGDVGYITAINSRTQSLTVKFDQGEAEFPLKDALKSLDLSYACTVHKFQGSEAPLIFFVAHESASVMLRTRNLVYTAITRAKNKCVIMGSERFLLDSSRQDALSKRKTRLCGLIKGMISLNNPPPEVLALSEQRGISSALAPSLGNGANENASESLALEGMEALPVKTPSKRRARSL